MTPTNLMKACSIELFILVLPIGFLYEQAGSVRSTNADRWTPRACSECEDEPSYVFG